ncbi:hypothetical protein ACWFNE_00545 [Cellulomonas sp. NPDC055163]
MSSRAELAAAVQVFRDLGWASVRVEDVEHLPVGTPEQQRVARAGLRSGAWGEHRHVGTGYRWVSHTGVDDNVLVLFAVRVGVDARRCVQVLTRTPFRVDHALAARLLQQRGPGFAARFVEAASRPNLRLWEHGLSALAGVTVRLVDELDLAVPDSVEYLTDWCVYAAHLLAGQAEAAGVDAPTAHAWMRSALPPGHHLGVEPERVLRRAAEHIRAAVAAGVPATGPLALVLPTAVRRGLLPREEGLELTVAALDAARRPGDRAALARVLTGPLAVTGAELVARVDALVPALAHGEPAVVEALAPALVTGVPDDALAEVLTVALLVRTRKAQRLLLTTAAGRARPADDVVEAVAPLVLPLAASTDRTLARAAAALVRAWAIPEEPELRATPTPQGLWRPTPALWQVPRFDVGEVSADALTAAAATLTRRPENDVVDIEVERFLALSNAVAHADPAAARTALGGVRNQWVAGLRCVPSWLAGETSPLADRPAAPRGEWPERAVVHGPLAAREAAVVARLGEVPVLLSTPTWLDLRIDPADLVVRLRACADAGAAVAEGDLYLALTRTDVALATDEVRAELATLDVPVVLGGASAGTRPGVRETIRRALGRVAGGSDPDVAAGPLAARYLLDPFVDPGLRRLDERWRHWAPGVFPAPSSLASLPVRVGPDNPAGPEVFPTWGDAAGVDVGSADGAEGGLRLRQVARRATPLPPGLAVNLVGAQRHLHPVAAPDASAAVMEAWERGLLVPGVADVGLLGWSHTPAGLGSFAAAALELAADGVLSVVWPLLDDALGASTRASRLLSGTAEVAEAVATLLPEVRAAVTAGIAPASALDLPGVRALAARSGSSRAVTAARAVVADLPPPAAPTAAPEVVVAPARPFDELWPRGAGTRPAVADGATLTVVPGVWRRSLALDVALPDGAAYRVDKQWFYDLEHEGQCEAVAHPVTAVATREARSWLRWDAAAGRLVVSPHRNWRGGDDGPLSPRTPTPPLTTSMVASLLLALCQDPPHTYYVLEVVGRGLVGSDSVTSAMRALLPSPLVSPARIAKPLDAEPTTLAVLWPVLVESVRHAATVDGTPPQWLHRVLDVTLHHAATLREAADRGLLPGDAAAWPGLRDLAATSRSAPVRRKAAALVEQLLRA